MKHFFIGRNQETVQKRILSTIIDFDAPCYFDLYSRQDSQHATLAARDIMLAYAQAMTDSEEVRRQNTAFEDRPFRDQFCILAVPQTYSTDKTIHGAAKMLTSVIYPEDITVVLAEDLDRLDEFAGSNAEKIRTNFADYSAALDRKYGQRKPLNWFKAKDIFTGRIPKKEEIFTNPDIIEEKWNSYLAVITKLGLDK